MSALLVVIILVVVLGAIALFVVGMAALETFLRAGRLATMQWKMQSLTKRNAAQQEMLANGHRNNERLRAEVTALTRRKEKP